MTQKREHIKRCSKITDNLDKIVSDAIGYHNKSISDTFEMYVRLFAVPKIKGEMTPGKLRCRGIIMVVESPSGNKWIEQRGKKISPTISDNMMLLHTKRPI